MENMNQEKKYKVTFFPKLNDGESIIVRFPYRSYDEIKSSIIPVHWVDKSGYVRCLRNNKEDVIENCPLCVSRGANTRQTRAFLKVMTYQKDASGAIVPQATVWAATYSFLVDLKAYLEQGDISGMLFSIKRTGTGTNTKYSLITLSGPQFNPMYYPANYEDFNEVKMEGVFYKVESPDTMKTTPVAPQPAYNTFTPATEAVPSNMVNPYGGNPNVVPAQQPYQPQQPAYAYSYNTAPQQPVTRVSYAQPTTATAPQPVRYTNGY